MSGGHWRSVVLTLLMGGEEWYAKLVQPKNGGTRTVLSQRPCSETGVYELPMGLQFEKMIYEVARQSQWAHVEGSCPGIFYPNA